MCDPMPRAPSLMSVLTADPAVATDLDRLVEELTGPFAELFQADLAAGGLHAEDLPAAIDTVCDELIERFLEDARLHGGYDILGPVERQEYAQIVVERVRRILRLGLGLAE